MHARNSLCGLFGGTFDPIHYGHLAPVREVSQAAELDQVIYIPAAVPPHRSQPRADAGHRLAMVRIALAGAPPDGPRLAVDDIELKRRGPSWTIDTLQSLRRRHPQRRYALIVGLDALLGLETWRRWRTLQRSVHIIAIGRPGWRPPHPLPMWWRAAQAQSAAELRGAAAGKILLVETTPVAVSATQVRACIKAGEDVSHLTPPGVCDYIREHNLYGGPHQTEPQIAP